MNPFSGKPGDIFMTHAGNMVFVLVERLNMSIDDISRHKPNWLVSVIYDSSSRNTPVPRFDKILFMFDGDYEIFNRERLDYLFQQLNILKNVKGLNT